MAQDGSLLFLLHSLNTVDEKLVNISVFLSLFLEWFHLVTMLMFFCLEF